jgi:hypothetical protein
MHRRPYGVGRYGTMQGKPEGAARGEEIERDSDLFEGLGSWESVLEKKKGEKPKLLPLG